MLLFKVLPLRMGRLLLLVILKLVRVGVHGILMRTLMLFSQASLKGLVVLQKLVSVILRFLAQTPTRAQLLSRREHLLLLEVLMMPLRLMLLEVQRMLCLRATPLDRLRVMVR